MSAHNFVVKMHALRRTHPPTPRYCDLSRVAMLHLFIPFLCWDKKISKLRAVSFKVLTNSRMASIIKDLNYTNFGIFKRLKFKSWNLNFFYFVRAFEGDRIPIVIHIRSGYDVSALNKLLKSDSIYTIYQQIYFVRLFSLLFGDNLNLYKTTGNFNIYFCIYYLFTLICLVRLLKFLNKELSRFKIGFALQSIIETLKLKKYFYNM